MFVFLNKHLIKQIFTYHFEVLLRGEQTQMLQEVSRAYLLLVARQCCFKHWLGSIFISRRTLSLQSETCSVWLCGGEWSWEGEREGEGKKRERSCKIAIPWNSFIYASAFCIVFYYVLECDAGIFLQFIWIAFGQYISKFSHCRLQHSVSKTQASGAVCRRISAVFKPF